jgi:hypothetical protein
MFKPTQTIFYDELLEFSSENWTQIFFMRGSGVIV